MSLFRTERGAVLARASVADDVGTVLEGVDLLIVSDIEDDQPIGIRAVMKCRRNFRLDLGVAPRGSSNLSLPAMFGGGCSEAT